MARRITLLIVLLSVCVNGQVPITVADAVNQLTASLEALKDADTAATSRREKISEGIMSVSEESHRPSDLSVAMFANALVSAVQGKQLSDAQLSQLATAVVAVMRSAGVATFKFSHSVSRVDRVLRSAGVNPIIAKRVSAQLEAVGNEVRGPEDLPALPRRR